MGAIQGAINQAMGAAAAAAGAVIHAKRQKELQAIVGETDAAQAADIQSEVEKLDSELGGKYLDVDNKKAEFAGTDQSTPIGRLKAVIQLSDIKAGERAIANLENKKAAKEMILKRLNKAVEKAKKINGGKK